MKVKKHRILHVIDSSKCGGAQVVVYNLILSLKEEYESSVVVLGKPGNYSRLFKEEDVPLYEIGIKLGRWNPLSLFRLIRLIKNKQYHLIHSHLPKSHILATIASYVTGSKMIIQDHTNILPESLKQRSYFSSSFVRNLYLWLYKYALLYCDHVIVLTPQTKQHYLNFYRIRNCEEKIIILPNGTNIQDQKQFSRKKTIHSELSLPINTKIVTMIGGLRLEKGWDIFLAVAENIQQRFDRACAFLVVGTGEEEFKLHQIMNSRQLNNVFFLGHRIDVSSILNQSDIFLLTSRSEAFSLALLEAMASDCPVISTRTTGPASIIEHGIDGLLANINDVETLSNYVIYLLNEEEVRQSLARKAKTKILQKYTFRDFTKKMSRIYYETLDNNTFHRSTG